MAKNRPMLNLSTTALCERILAGDLLAAREGQIRVAHGVRPYNERKLSAALGLAVHDDDLVSPAVPAPVAVAVPAPVAVAVPAPVAVEGVSPELIAQIVAQVLAGQVVQSSKPESMPVSAPAPAPATPRKARVNYEAANLFGKRVSALKAAERKTLVARAKSLALAEGLTAEDVASLSDEECLALVG
jgi:hypothetical protein